MDKNNLIAFLKDLIAQGKTEKAIKILVGISGQLEKDTSNKIILLSNSFQEQKKEFLLNLDKKNEINTKTIYAVIDLIDGLESELIDANYSINKNLNNNSNTPKIVEKISNHKFWSMILVGVIICGSIMFYFFQNNDLPSENSVIYEIGNEITKDLLIQKKYDFYENYFHDSLKNVLTKEDIINVREKVFQECGIFNGFSKPKRAVPYKKDNKLLILTYPLSFNNCNLFLELWFNQFNKVTAIYYLSERKH